MTEQVTPFQLEIPEEQPADLRQRLALTRWPDRETVPDTGQGPQLAEVQALVHFDEVAAGGHVAALEQPDLLVEEIRTTFRSSR